MRILFLCFFFCCGVVEAKSIPFQECQKEGEKLEITGIVFFNQAELISLGRCLGVAVIKRGKSLNLVDACAEVEEDRLSVLGVLTLSKAEAIEIGQCLGVIQYIYNKYDMDPKKASRFQYSSSDKYQCKKGMPAVKKIIALNNIPLTKYMLRDSLCY